MKTFEKFLQAKFNYYYSGDPTSIIGFGRGYHIGNSKDDCIKLDLMYTDPFIHQADIIDGSKFFQYVFRCHKVPLVFSIAKLRQNKRGVLRAGKRKFFQSNE